MITFEQAKNLKIGDELHHYSLKNADGTCQRWRVNGAVKLWKTRPDQIKVPIKRGMREFGYLVEWNLSDFHLASECPRCSRSVDRFGSEDINDISISKEGE